MSIIRARALKPTVILILLFAVTAIAAIFSQVWISVTAAIAAVAAGILVRSAVIRRNGISNSIGSVYDMRSAEFSGADIAPNFAAEVDETSLTSMLDARIAESRFLVITGKGRDGEFIGAVLADSPDGSFVIPVTVANGALDGVQPIDDSEEERRVVKIFSTAPVYSPDRS
ncbi:hypothetical protein ACWD4X_08185 [Streptomyces termitum]